MKRTSLLYGAVALVCVASLPFWAVGQSSNEWYQQSKTDAAGELQESPVIQLPKAAPVSQEKRTVRLNYIRGTWDRILNDLAEASESTLVVHHTPRGTFSRTDFRKYTPDEAIRILNESLHEQGCRILRNEKFLTVISARSSRPRYTRRQFDSTDQVSGERYESHSINSANGTPIRSASYKRNIPNDRELGSFVGQGSQKQVDLRQVFTYSLANETATTVAKQMHVHWMGRSRLVNEGPEGLPAFEVYEAGTGKKKTGEKILLTAGIDTERNRLVVEATEKAGKEFIKLANALDRRDDSNTVKLLEADKNRIKLAEKVKAMATVFQKAKGKNSPNYSLAMQTSSQNTQTEQNGTSSSATKPMVEDASKGESPEKPSLNNPQSLPSLLETLKGDVTVEGLNELNLLILRGNEQDVNAVMNVIRAIEGMAAGSTPEIHLRRLRAVNSEGMAVLLNDVYEKLTTLRATNTQPIRMVNVIPVVTPNAIIILAPETVLPSVLDLTDELDQPVDPAAEVEVFFLKSAVAADAAELLENFYEEREGLGQRVKVTPDPRTNSLVVQARPRDLVEVAHLIDKLDRDHSRAVGRLKVIQLKHAIAEDLAEFLTTMISNLSSTVNQQGVGNVNNQASQGLNSPKSMVLEFMTRKETTDKLLRSGILTDARITADTRSNSLAVSAPPASMKFLEELISVLDQPTPTVADIKMFPLKNADASAAVELLETLFADEQEEQIGVQLAGADDANSGLVPLRFSVDGRTNTVIAKGGSDALRVVEAILLRLDESDQRRRRVSVLKLRHTPATDIANSINEFLEAKRALAEIDPTRTSASELLNQEIIVTPEPISNNLVIEATPEYFDEIFRIAKELDKQPSQVIIQALLVEVELNDTDEFGIELGYQDSVLFDRGIIDNLLTITETVTNGQIQTTNQRIISQEVTPGFNFNNQPLGSNANSPATVGTQSLSNFGLGRVNGDLGFGGFVFSAGSERVNVLIRALAARRDVKILSRPQILALDNQTAQIQVGQQVPVVDGVNITATGVANPNIRQDEAGIILTVTPRISPEGMIVMETIAEKSAFNGEGVPIFTDATTGNVVESPIKDITTAQTTISVPDGQTIVVGGMITKTDDRLERKVPWLGDIPVLGQAFRYDSFSSQRTELLIFLTPRIIHNDSDSEWIKQIEAERMQFFVEEAEEIHGPLFGVPNAETIHPGYGQNRSQQKPNVSPGQQSQGGNVPSTHVPGKTLTVSDSKVLADATKPETNAKAEKVKSATWNPRTWFKKRVKAQ